MRIRLEHVTHAYAGSDEAAAVQVLDKDGHEVKTVGALKRDGKTLHLPLTAKLPEGQFGAH